MSEYRRGTRVIVNEDLPGVPEGTSGKCGRGIGFAIKRYRVRFDNDVEAISVAHSKLVPEDEWPQFLAQRARAEIEAAQERARVAEARAAAAESRGLPAPSTDEPAAQGAAEPTPAAAAPAPAEPAADGGGTDPRLAAMLAKSKSAREAAGVPAPESSPAPAAESADAEPTAAPAAEPAAAAAAPAASPTRSAPPSGPERAELPEFVPGPEVDPDYTPAANRVSELISESRKDG